MTTGPVEIGRACPRCGTASAPEARFCARCGAGMETVAAPPPPAWTPPMAPAAPAAPPAAPAARSILATAPFPGIEPSSVGRRASPLGWAGVVLGAACFLALALAVMAAAGMPGPDGAGTTSAAPLARFDSILHDGGSVTDGVPWEIEVEAVNPAASPTDPLWMVIEWAPDGGDGKPGPRGRFVACDPATCEAREDASGRRTIVSWPGLPTGERRVLRTTVVATGLEPFIPLAYRVTTGSGPTEVTMDGGNTWNLELETE
jgi:hypothetical protein